MALSGSTRMQASTVQMAAAGWALGRFGERDEEEAPPPLNIDYLKGLNFLLN